MTKAIRIGVIGMGSVSESYIPHVRRLPLEGVPCEIVVACDLRASQKARAEAHQIADFTMDPAEVIGRADVDLVMILTAMPSHGPLALAALKAGKHVLLEKPMSIDLAEAREMLELSRTSAGNLVCAPHVTLSPVYREIAQCIANGEIGRPLSARGLYGWAGPDWASWFYEPGGGPMFDLGVYNVTTLTGLLGPAKRVVALGTTALPQRMIGDRKIKVEIEDNVHLLLEFDGGCIASIATGFTMQKYRTPGIEIYGSEGTVQMIGEDWGPQGYELWRNDRACWEVHELGGGWRWTDGIRDLIQSAQEGRKPVNPPDHAFHVLEVMSKCHESILTGRAIDIASTFIPLVFENHAARLAPHLDHAPN